MLCNLNCIYPCRGTLLILNDFCTKWLGEKVQWSYIRLSWGSKKGQSIQCCHNLPKLDVAENSHLKKYHIYTLTFTLFAHIICYLPLLCPSGLHAFHLKEMGFLIVVLFGFFLSPFSGKEDNLMISWLKES